MPTTANTTEIKTLNMREQFILTLTIANTKRVKKLRSVLTLLHQDFESGPSERWKNEIDFKIFTTPEFCSDVYKLISMLEE